MAETKKNITFTKRSIPIPADYRPLYKIGHILLILSVSSRGGKASLMKIHFLSWAIKSKRNSETVMNWIKTDFKQDFHIWGIEPTVNRALTLAAADQLILESGGQYELAERGKQYIKLVMKDGGIYEDEIAFLNKVGKSLITEAKIQELSKKLF
jgi:hypothetical protein